MLNLLECVGIFAINKYVYKVLNRPDVWGMITWFIPSKRELLFTVAGICLYHKYINKPFIECTVHYITAKTCSSCGVDIADENLS